MERICLICRKRGCLKHKKILDEIYQKMDGFKKIKDEFQGSSVSPFVGSYGYPKLNVGILAPPQIVEDAWRMDSPSYWYQMKYGINKIISHRANLLNSRKTIGTKNVYDNFLEVCQEIALAKKEVDTEFDLKKEPSLSFRGGRLPPILSSAIIKKARTVENVSVPRKVDEVVNDEMKATNSVFQLYENDVDVDKINRILSVGLLGLPSQRKIVPTRFSITAVDDIIGKRLVEEVKDYPELDEFLIFENTYVGNHYTIIFMPGEYSFELMEARLPNSMFKISNLMWHQDYEDYFMRKKYAESTAGAFYSGRLACVEKLREMKRQGSILIIREIFPEYFFPIGIWQMREAIRGAVRGNVRRFNTLKEVLEELDGILRVSVNDLIIKSKLLGTKRSQRRLTSFVS